MKANKETIISEILSDKHKLFADVYLTNGFNALKAYKEVYKDCKEKSAESASSRLLENVKIQQYIKQKQNETANKHNITRDSLVEELNEVKELAKVPDQFGKINSTAIIKAIEVQAKLLGLNEAEKSEVELKGLKVIKVNNP